MKPTLAIALLSLAFPAYAASYYSSPSKRPVVCNNPDIAVQVDLKLHEKQPGAAAQDLMNSGHCRIYAAGIRFEIVASQNGYSQIKIPGEESVKPQYISGSEAALLGPFDSPYDEPKYAPGCSAPIGGEIQRLETGKDGQLFLKRYLITSKCIDGKMRSFTKRLN